MGGGVRQESIPTLHPARTKKGRVGPTHPPNKQKKGAELAVLNLNLPRPPLRNSWGKKNQWGSAGINPYACAWAFFTPILFFILEK